MWVYLDTRSCGNCVCVEVQPNMTALEMTYCVIREAKRMDGECGSEQNLYLHEVVLGGMMERPIHHSEIMLEVTLKWGQWSEPDRRENYLLLKSNTFYSEALPCALPPMSVFGEANFSDNKPGKATFKKHQVRFWFVQSPAFFYFELVQLHFDSFTILSTRFCLCKYYCSIGSHKVALVERGKDLNRHLPQWVVSRAICELCVRVNIFLAL